MQHPLDDFTYGQLNALVKKVGGKDGVDNVLSGKWVVGEPAKVSKPKRAAKRAEPPLDTTIHLDRSVKPTYPDWVKDVLHPDLTVMGRGDYDLTTDVSLWLHDGQKDGKSVRGQVIYDYLKANDMLSRCLGLADGVAIQQKGVAVFRKRFGDNVVFLWRDVVRYRNGDLRVPCVCVFGGEVVVLWGWLGYYWDGDSPAARFVY